MLVAELNANGFDILNVAETETSLVRQSDFVRLSWKDEQNRLIQLVKNTVMTPTIGTLLIAKGDCLLPTGDRHSGTTVGKLLAPMSAFIQTKQVTINGTVYTAKLLPVQIL